MSRIDKETTVGILDWCLEQLSDDNKDLRLRNKDLEKLLVDERTKSFKVGGRMNGPLRWALLLKMASGAKWFYM